MPISVPVPKEYAEKYDKKTPSTYGEGHAVYTGPYMVESDAEGKAIGYVPGKRIHLVRNPDYTPVDDFRPAFLDEIDVPGAATRTRPWRRGASCRARTWRCGELEPPASQLKRLLESNKTELSAVPGGGWRMISMDTSRPPFDDIDVRKAVIAGFNRAAARQQRGGEALGPIAQHLHPAGHGGLRGVQRRRGLGRRDGLDGQAGGRPRLSAEYFKKAGMRLRASTRATRSS